MDTSVVSEKNPFFFDWTKNKGINGINRGMKQFSQFTTSALYSKTHKWQILNLLIYPTLKHTPKKQ